MESWAKHPVLYEVNTWVWLWELSRKYRRPVFLRNVPAEEWDSVADLRVDAVWLMGIWERSPAGRRVALANEGLREEFRRALPDYTLGDVIGSAYCVRRYRVDEHLGGPEGLAEARKKLADRGIRLILDFVPNHLAIDHPWVFEHPEYFIQGNKEDLTRASGEFFEAGGRILAHGRDPYFPPWQDVGQLNAFHPGLRQDAIETACDIASQCDGMRCDMAMLLINEIFEKAWGPRTGVKPEEEYWRKLIPAVRTRFPDVLFIAESYWDLEWELQQQGFDLCYDKRLYDRLVHDTAESVRLHLLADLTYQERLLRFIENHDEPRAASTFSPQKQRAAAITIGTLPGAKLFHEGQVEGRKVKLPVFLCRRPEEPADSDLQAFYRKLLRTIDAPSLRGGHWQLCERHGWPDNQSFVNLVAWCWRREEERYLVAVNLSDRSVQCRVRLPWDDLKGHLWCLWDIFMEKAYDRDGSEMVDPGLYVDIRPWGFHFLKWQSCG